jgi:hypothetical protein
VAALALVFQSYAMWIAGGFLLVTLVLGGVFRSAWRQSEA